MYDIESNKWVHFEVLGFFDGKEFRTFDSVTRFLSAIDNERYNGWIFYAHNGGRFDILFLLEALIKKYQVKFIERGGRIIAAKVQGKRSSYTLADSYALLPQSLKALGQAFQTEHQKIEHDVSKGVSKKSKKLLRYLANDCYCLFEVIQVFRNSPYVVKPQLTIASQALDTWRKQFLEHEHELKMLPIEREELFRERYYSGGRVEVYKGYGKGIHCFDVNSLYPFAMLNEMPIGEAEETSVFQKGCIGFYHVRLKSTPQWYISPLLVKRKHENLYVNGAGDYFLSSAMLEYLRSTWGIRFEVVEGLYFKRKAYLFNPYVEKFYALKQKSKGTAEYLIAKLMLVSLYGKLGMRRQREKIESYRQELDFHQIDYTWLSEELGLVLTLESTKSKFVLPYLAGYITELARLYHYRLMSLDFESMYYCDTDSLYTSNSKPYMKLVSTDIGKLSHEGPYNEAVFVAPKTYALKNRTHEIVKFKGFDAEAFDFESLYNSLRKHDELVQTRQRILSFREAAKLQKVQKTTRKIVESGGTYLKLVETEKKQETSYDKRIIVEDSACIYNTDPLLYNTLTKRKD